MGQNFSGDIHYSLTAIPGLTVGHWTDLEAATGCTVILCPAGAVAGVDVRGGAPGTREIALLAPTCTVEHIHAIVLSGGSAFGLAAADGVMHWLEEHGYGFAVGPAKVPIVPAAIIFDLHLGRADRRPDAVAGYTACVAATAGPVAEGTVGAGTGATVGKLLGIQQATKGGVGTAGKRIGTEIVVAALAVVNPVGEVFDPRKQQVIAGVRNPQNRGFASAMALLEERIAQPTSGLAASNTTLAVVATNVALTKSGATKVAQMAHDGLARTIRPVHTESDGDIVFALSLGNQPGAAGVVGAVAAEVLAEAILRAVENATALHGIPATRDLSF